MTSNTCETSRLGRNEILSLDRIYNSCYETASQLKDWQKLNKNEIANLYLDNRNNESGSIYAAALLCRYWYKVGLLWKNNKRSMTEEQCYETVWDGIERAIDYAPWRNAENSLYQDPNGPDKAINICIDSVRKSFYAFSSRDKRKANHKANANSLESMWELAKDYSMQFLEDCEAVDDKFLTKELNVTLYIKDLIAQGNLPEAIIIDNICFDDSLAEDENGMVGFSRRKVINNIHNLGKVFIKYFTHKYDVPADVLIDCLKQINSLSKPKMQKLVARTLYCARLYGGF